MSQYPYHRVVTTEWSYCGSTSHIAPPTSGCASGLDQAGLDLEPAGRGTFCPRAAEPVLQQGEYRKGLFGGLQPIVPSVLLPMQDEERLGTWAGDTLPEAFLLQ